MKDITETTEYQLLYLAVCEVKRRIKARNADIANGETKQSPRRTQALVKMYDRQLGEIIARMSDINNAE